MYATHFIHRHLILGTLSLIFYGYALLPGFASENLLQMLERDFQKVVTGARSAVVKVVVTQEVPLALPLDAADEKLAFTRQNIGSGIVIDAAGHIVTTGFDMGTPSQIEVIFGNNAVVPAAVVGTDTITDITVLRLTGRAPDPETASPIFGRIRRHRWGDSSEMQTGSWVVTIGSAYGNSPIVSFGIVGGWDILPNQLCGELLKINAAVTPGNSGGAVVNTSGEIVGMILAVLAEPTHTNTPGDAILKAPNADRLIDLLRPASGNQEITFAVPIEQVREVATEIITHGKVARGWLGVQVGPSESGVRVMDVFKHGPADKGGLLPEDVIMEFNETPVRSYTELSRCVVNQRPNTVVRLKVSRNRIEREYTVILGDKDRGETLKTVLEAPIGAPRR